MNRKLSRRELALGVVAATASAPIAGRPVLAQEAPAPLAPQTTRSPGPLPETLPFGRSIQFTRNLAPKKVSAFPLRDVSLTGGPFKLAQDANLAYVKRLDNDRLLHNFRVNAGLPSSAQPLGGWEKPDCELRGHFVGHLLSACALLYSSTGDTDIKTKGDTLVSALAECQAKLGGGYLSAFPSEYLDRLKTHTKVWAPFYTYHKILAGMLDMSQQCGNAQALEVAKGMASWTDAWTKPIPEEQMQSILNVEYGGMNEVLYNLAFVTGDDQFAVVGDRFTKKWFFNPLALRRDELRGLHANTHIPQVIGAARRYELSSDVRFHDVADFFWYEVTSARSYATGGTSNAEHWKVEPRRLGAELTMSTETAECCCVYNMLKLTRTLYEWTADGRYFDYYERVLLNHRLGTIKPETGHTQYFLSLASSAWRTFGTETDSFWCCNGTGVEEYAKLNDSIYFHDGDGGLYINLFIPSKLTWPEKGLTLRQQTNFPELSSTELLLTATTPIEMPIRIRIPSWTGSNATVKINGKLLEAAPSPGSYLTLQRVWKTGDRIELEMAMSLHMEAMPDEPNTQAILYGPLVLAGDLGKGGLTTEMTEGQMGPKLTNSATEVLTSSIQRANKPLSFRATGKQQNVNLQPFYKITDERYTIYWTVIRS